MVLVAAPTSLATASDGSDAAMRFAAALVENATQEPS